MHACVRPCMHAYAGYPHKDFPTKAIAVDPRNSPYVVLYAWPRVCSRPCMCQANAGASAHSLAMLAVTPSCVARLVLALVPSPPASPSVHLTHTRLQCSFDREIHDHGIDIDTSFCSAMIRTRFAHVVWPWCPNRHRAPSTHRCTGTASSTAGSRRTAVRIGDE